MRAEVAAAEARGKTEAEKAGLQTALDAALSRAEAEQSSLQSSIHRLETETKDYKVSHVMHAALLRMLLSRVQLLLPPGPTLYAWTRSHCIWWHSVCTANQMVQTWIELCHIGSHMAWFLQARAHTLLRQKEVELSRARESAAQQFQADVTAAEAATQHTQHLLEQVGQIVSMRCIVYLDSSVTSGETSCSELNNKLFHYSGQAP
jgi:hypothetical protein